MVCVLPLSISIRSVLDEGMVGRLAGFPCRVLGCGPRFSKQETPPIRPDTTRRSARHREKQERVEVLSKMHSP